MLAKWNFSANNYSTFIFSCTWLPFLPKLYWAPCLPPRTPGPGAPQKLELKPVMCYMCRTLRGPSDRRFKNTRTGKRTGSSNIMSYPLNFYMNQKHRKVSKQCYENLEPPNAYFPLKCPQISPCYIKISKNFVEIDPLLQMALIEIFP